MEAFVGDTIDIRLRTGIDTSPYTIKYIKYQRPDGSVGHWVASTDPTDNTYIYISCDKSSLNVPGTWKIQAYLKNSNEVLHGQRTDLTVLAPIY